MTMRKIGVLIIILVLCIATVLVAYFSSNGGNVTVTQGTDSVKISATNAGSTTISYTNVESIKLVTTSFDIGECIEGVSNNKITAGEWECDTYDDFGTYYLFAYTSVDTYIVITTPSKYVVFNCSSAQDTEQLYDSLVLAIEGEQE